MRAAALLAFASSSWPASGRTGVATSEIVSLKN
jgi:hypothetical protein